MGAPYTKNGFQGVQTGEFTTISFSPFRWFEAGSYESTDKNEIEGEEGVNAYKGIFVIFLF